MTVKVWRYEGQNGNGPYATPWDRQLDLADEHDVTDDHPKMIPIPLRDKVGVLDWLDCYSATTSLSALVDWFMGWHEELQRGGFEITCYEVPVDDVTRPDHVGQVGFLKERAIKL